MPPKAENADFYGATDSSGAPVSRRASTENSLPLTYEPQSNNCLPKELAGLLLAFITCQCGFFLADLLGQQIFHSAPGKSPISGIPVSILLGTAMKNLGVVDGIEEVTGIKFAPGLTFSSITVLQAGIICVAAKLSLLNLVQTGFAGIPAIIACVSAGILSVHLIATFFDLPPKFALLTAAGTAICGVTAIGALAPGISASQKDISLAVANVVLFGTFGMLCYPHLVGPNGMLGSSETGLGLLTTSQQRGIFLGLAIHDTSQVTGAAMTYHQVYNDEVVLKTAIITKLSRNLLLALVIPGLTWWYQSRMESGVLHDAVAVPSVAASLWKHFPLFLWGFLLMCCLRSTGDYYVYHVHQASDDHLEKQWISLTNFIAEDLGGHFLLGTAMAAIGLLLCLSVFKGVGMKEFAPGMGGALSVGCTAVISIQALSAVGLYK